MNKKCICILLTLALVLTNLAVLPDAAGAATKATLAKKKITITVGKTYTVKLKNKNAKYQYTYTVNNKAVATVSKKGVIKGIKAGTAKVTVKEVYKVSGCKKTRKVGTLAVTVKASAASTSVDFHYEALDTSWITPGKKLVAFAFDDGPIGMYDGSSAKSILDTLKANKQHATFFYWGNKITDSNKDEIKYAQEIGCEIGNHTWSHPYLTNMKAADITEQIEKTRATLEGITGLHNFLVRPPYLATNPTVLNTIKVPLVTCSLDSGDWNSGTKDSVKNRIMTAFKNGNLENSVLLMHENYDFTAQVVAEMVPYLVSNGYQVVSVSELAAMNKVTLTSGKVYSWIEPQN